LRPHPLQLALPLAVLALATPTPAQARPPAPNLLAPVRLQAGDKPLGTGRLAPSPVFHDINGDGLVDIVVGDLRGRLTVALRKPGELAFGAEEPIKDVEGKELEFHNW
jgi:hypothetical protein